MCKEVALHGARGIWEYHGTQNVYSQYTDLLQWMEIRCSFYGVILTKWTLAAVLRVASKLCISYWRGENDINETSWRQKSNAKMTA